MQSWLCESWDTLPNFNIEPKNDGVQKESPIPGYHFRFHVKLLEGTLKWWCKSTNRKESPRFIAVFPTLRPFYVGDLVTLNKTGDMAMNEAVVGTSISLWVPPWLGHGKIGWLGGGFQYFWNFHPEHWGRFPFWLIFFQRGWFNHQLDEFLWNFCGLWLASIKESGNHLRSIMMYPNSR